MTKILLVDNEQFFIKLISTYLEKHSHTVYPAASGKEALRILKEKDREIDILITDINMPEMDGTVLS